MTTKPAIKYNPRQLILMGVALVALIGVLVWSQSGPAAPPRGFVSRAAMGDVWPLSVESGTLRCIDGTMVVIDASDGTTYAVNGTANGAKNASGQPRWADVKQVAVQRADAPGLIKDLTPLLNQGLALC